MKVQHCQTCKHVMRCAYPIPVFPPGLTNNTTTWVCGLIFRPSDRGINVCLRVTEPDMLETRAMLLVNSQARCQICVAFADFWTDRNGNLQSVLGQGKQVQLCIVKYPNLPSSRNAQVCAALFNQANRPSIHSLNRNLGFNDPIATTKNIERAIKHDTKSDDDDRKRAIKRL